MENRADFFAVFKIEGFFWFGEV